MAGSQKLQEPYDILLIGRTGFGKSTTGNKLLSIKEGAVITLWNRMEDEVRYFKTEESSASVTTKCKLLSNDHNIRVLDTPGFGNSQLTKELGGMEWIFQKILQEQEKHNLAFRRVLYFLPKRGPLECEEGTLQDEIRAIHEFWGEDIFNVMIIIATNTKRSQIDFEQKDLSTIEKVFSAAYKTVTGKRLKKCPPILYLPLAETDAISKIMSTNVVIDVPWKKKPVGKPLKKEKAPVKPQKGDKPVEFPTREQFVLPPYEEEDKPLITKQPVFPPPSHQKGEKPKEPPTSERDHLVHDAKRKGNCYTHEDTIINKHASTAKQEVVAVTRVRHEMPYEQSKSQSSNSCCLCF